MEIKKTIKTYWLLILVVSAAIVIVAVSVHKSTFSQYVKDQEKRLMTGYVSKLISIAEQNPNALVGHGMGPTLGEGSDEFYEPLEHCRKFLKARFFLQHPNLPKSFEKTEFLRLDYYGVNDFIDWAKDTYKLNEQVAFLSPDRLEFYRCILIGFVRYKETDGREVFHWQQGANFAVPDSSRIANRT